MEYALAHQDQMKCLVISNMMASIPAYNAYAKKVLEPKMDQAVLKQILDMEKTGKTEQPAYMNLLMPNWYEQHILRRPAAQWPEPVLRAEENMNRNFYVTMQGPSEMGASGRLVNWDRFNDLKRITIPTLVISGKYDTMDPAYMAAMAKQLPHGELAATNGGHMDMYDDQPTYFAKLIAFLKLRCAEPTPPPSASSARGSARPAGDALLLAALEREAVGLDVAGDDRARADDRAVADASPARPAPCSSR